MPEAVELVMREVEGYAVDELLILSWRARKEAIDRLRHARMRFKVGMLVQATVHGVRHVGTVVRVGERTLRLANASGDRTTVPADVARRVDRDDDGDGRT
jgi:hypothetical protein